MGVLTPPIGKTSTGVTLPFTGPDLTAFCHDGTPARLRASVVLIDDTGRFGGMKVVGVNEHVARM